MKVAIILPTYNERENVSHLLPEIFKVFEQNKIKGEVIIVDDSSPDGTAQVVKELQNKFPLHLIQREKKLGLGSAYVLGFKKALELNFEIIFEMDADFSHSPWEIPHFLEKLDECDMVIGSRRIKGGKVIDRSWSRKLISWGGNFLGNHISGVKIKDLTSGYRAYKSEVLNKIGLNNLKSDGYAFQLEILARALKKGFKVESIPITFRERRCGHSKLSKKDILSFFLLTLKLRFNLL